MHTILVLCSNYSKKIGDMKISHQIWCIWKITNKRLCETKKYLKLDHNCEIRRHTIHIHENKKYIDREKTSVEDMSVNQYRDGLWKHIFWNFSSQSILNALLSLFFLTTVLKSPRWLKFVLVINFVSITRFIKTVKFLNRRWNSCIEYVLYCMTYIVQFTQI